MQLFWFFYTNTERYLLGKRAGVLHAVYFVMAKPCKYFKFNQFIFDNICFSIYKIYLLIIFSKSSFILKAILSSKLENEFFVYNMFLSLSITIIQGSHLTLYSSEIFLYLSTSTSVKIKLSSMNFFSSSFTNTFSLSS